MKKIKVLAALAVVAALWALVYGACRLSRSSDDPTVSASGLYSKPTYSQIERLIAAAGGTASQGGSSIYSSPTYSQVERLIGVTRESASRSAVVVIPDDAAERGVTFTCNKHDPADPDVLCGEEDNGAVEIGAGAKAAVTQDALSAARDGTVARSVSVAIGAEADATVSPGSTKNQAIAIGWHAQAKGSTAIAIGSGAQHSFEDALSGAAAYAREGESVAIGYGAKSTAARAVQFGAGTNSTPMSLQFRQWQVVDGSGQIPRERLVRAASELTGDVIGQLERLLQPGNMTVVYGIPDVQIVEPRLDGVSELELSKGTNDVYMAGSEVGVVPPLGSRNYDVVVPEVPQAYRRERNGSGDMELLPVPPEENFILTFENIPADVSVRIRCDSTIGYVNGTRTVVVTNAPYITKVRQTATNRVVVVIKPWDEIADL